MISGRRPSGGGSSVRAGRLVDTYRSQAVNSCRRAGRSAAVVGMWGLRLRRVAPLIAYRSPLIMPRDGQLGIDARGPKSLITRAGCRLVLKIRRLGTMLDVPTERARPALTNLAYLDWLRDSVAPPDQARHGKRDQPARGLPAAAGTDLPADRQRPQRRQRRAVDAAGRHAQRIRRTAGDPGRSEERRVG